MGVVERAIWDDICNVDIDDSVSPLWTLGRREAASVVSERGVGGMEEEGTLGVVDAPI